MQLGNLWIWALCFLSGVLAAKADDAADEAAGETRNPSQSPNLNVKISTTFPQAEIFGVKLVNGHPTEAILSVDNQEPQNVVLQFVGGSLWTPDFGEANPSRLIRNLTTTAYRGDIPAGEKETFAYRFTTELHPADVVLKLTALVADEQNAFYSVPVFEGGVSVVEAPTSIFDPQILFLYLILAGGFVGTAYFVYRTWLSTFFPQTKRRGGDSRSRGGAAKSRKTDASGEKVGAAGADGASAAAMTTGSKAYDESWIPAEHLKRPEAKRIKSGTPSGVKTKKAA